MEAAGHLSARAVHRQPDAGRGAGGGQRHKAALAGVTAGVIIGVPAHTETHISGSCLRVPLPRPAAVGHWVGGKEPQDAVVPLTVPEGAARTLTVFTKDYCFRIFPNYLESFGRFVDRSPYHILCTHCFGKAMLFWAIRVY